MPLDAPPVSDTSSAAQASNRLAVIDSDIHPAVKSLAPPPPGFRIEFTSTFFIACGHFRPFVKNRKEGTETGIGCTCYEKMAGFLTHIPHQRSHGLASPNQPVGGVHAKCAAPFIRPIPIVAVVITQDSNKIGRHESPLFSFEKGTRTFDPIFRGGGPCYERIGIAGVEIEIPPFFFDLPHVLST